MFKELTILAAVAFAICFYSFDAYSQSNEKDQFLKTECDTIADIDAKELDEIAVTAKIPYAKIKGSTIIYDISRSPLGDLPTTDDVLSQLPTVKTSEGGYKIMGRGNATIYIGNRKILDLSEIQRLRPIDIKSIEVIRNPGTEYEAETSSIIKINLKKNPLNGFGVDALTQFSQGRRFSDYEQLSFTYGLEKINAFLTVSNSTYRSNTDQFNQQNIYTPYSDWNMNTDMPHWKYHSNDIVANGGMMVAINDKQSLGGQFTYTHNNQENTGPKISTMKQDDLLYEELTGLTSNPQNYEQWQTNLFYDGSLSQSCDFNINLDFINRTSKSNYFNEESGSLTPDHSVSNRSDIRYNLWSGNAKLKWDMDNMCKFVFGIDGSGVYQDRKSSQSDPYSKAALNSDEIKYAAFIQYGLSKGIWSVDAGLRYEANSMKYVDRLSGISIVNKTYRRLYPDASISLKAGQTNMSFGFSSRIKRPTFYQLRNSSEYFNRYETTEGNPHLLPTYTYELQYSFQYKDLTANIGYEWIHDFITEEETINSDNPLHMTSRPVNKPKFTALNFGCNYDKRISLWHFYVSANAVKSFYNINPMNYKMAHISKAPLIELSWSNYLTFNGYTIFSSLGYNPDGAWYNTWEYQNLNLNLGIYKRFLNDNLYVALKVNNVTRSKSKYRIYYNNSFFERDSFKDNQRVFLTLSYTLRHNRKYNGVSSARNEINRM